MLPTQSLLLPLFGSVAGAADLWASHYTGTINHLTFDGGSLNLSSSYKPISNLPSWLTYDGVGKKLYLTDETFLSATSANLVSFTVGPNGNLTPAGNGSTPLGGVASTLYGGTDGRGFIVNAHYQSSQISTFKLPLNGGGPLQTVKYNMSGPGANPNRQDAPHPHQVIVDPTGEFIIVPDLGADLIRIHKVDKSTGRLTECPSVKQAPGTGPRHGAFWSPTGYKSRTRRAAQDPTLFISNELSNSVSRWSVSYPYGGCLTLSLKQTLTSYQGNATATAGTKIGEIRVKGNFVYVSNRNDKKFAPNDSITQFTVASDSSFKWTDITSSYGTYPRTFDINKAGDYVAVGDQTTSNVAIVARNPTTGKLGNRIADLRVGPVGTPESEDGLSSVIWAE